jgi:hypothetical protein
MRETHVMPNCADPVEPAKLLEIVRRWCPGAPVEVPLGLINALVEAAANSSSGELRLGILEDFVCGLAAQLCSNSQKLAKLKKATARMAGDPLHRPKLRPGHTAELARAALAAVGRAYNQVLGVEEIEGPDAGQIAFVGRYKKTAAAKCKQTSLWGVP